MVKIQDLDFEIKFVEGKLNVLADLCSRPEDTNISPLADLMIKNSINAIQLLDENEDIIALQTEEFIDSIKKPGLNIEKIDNCYYETSTELLRIILPQPFREIVIQSAHNLGHFGNNKTYNSVSRNYFWPHMRKQVYNFVQTCVICQRNKLSKNIKRDSIRFPLTTKFKTVHIDIVGPLKRSRNGNTYILTMIDRCTSWVEAVPLRTISAEQVASKFYNNWVCRFGIPDFIITDQGSQFESELFNSLLNMLGIVRKRTTAYHPQSNGKIERFHRTLKNTIRCLIDQSGDWEKHLPTALYAIRIAQSADGYCPSLLVYGEEINVPWTFMTHPVDRMYSEDSDFMSELKNSMLQFNEDIMTDDFNIENLEQTFTDKYVWIKDPLLKSSLECKYLGPFEVIAVDYPVLTINRNGTNYKINIDRVKPARFIRQTEVDEPDIVSDNENILLPDEPDASEDNIYLWTDFN